MGKKKCKKKKTASGGKQLISLEIDENSAFLYGWKPSLNGRESLPHELIGWLQSRDISVRQAKELLEVAKCWIEGAWCSEEGKVKL